MRPHRPTPSRAHSLIIRLLATAAAAAAVVPAVPLLADFVNFETPQVSPIAVSPDGRVLAAGNTADNRVELWDLSAGGAPVPLKPIPVGLDPVSVRFRTDRELWVVNQLSDSVSVVDLDKRAVVRTLATDDEPADVAFAGDPARAFVTCSSVDRVLVFDPTDPGAAPVRLELEGEDPRALAVSPDGTTVYAAIFESGNRSTILGGGADDDTDILDFPPNVVSDPRGPYGGANPPPNAGPGFDPPINPAAGPPPRVGLIVKQDAAGAWRDDNGADWTDFVSGPLAGASGRPAGWELIDHDVAAIDATTLDVTYMGGLMNACMAIAVNPADGRVAVVGTDAINEVRFEPNVNGVFVRVLMASVDPADPGAAARADLNPHLDYAAPRAPQAVRDRSIGDPRGLAWTTDGARGFVTGMGSNNVVVVGGDGARLEGVDPVEVGAGPTGVALDAGRGRLYVLNRFDASISVIDAAEAAELHRVPFFDPTPEPIRRGRPFLYDTHRTSGLGHVSCASCHIDARIDRLAWDLGDPSGEVKDVDAGTHNLGASVPGLNSNFTDFHPMKGPMTTQTLQDIIGHEPHHWRGDRDGLEEFNPAFVGLLGDDAQLTPDEMQAFEDFLATITFPPNPFRNLDNSLPEALPLPGHFASGRFSPEGSPMPAGNARRALNRSYIPLNRAIDQGTFACVTCHTLPTGTGTDTRVNLFPTGFIPIPPGPNGERHHALVSVDGSSQRAFKIPQLRNLYDKVGFETTQTRSRAGFGFAHDGTVDSLSRFLSEPAFAPDDDQEVADLVALMLSFSGSGFGDPVEALQPPGTASMDAHAAVGRQVTRTGSTPGDDDDSLMRRLLALADAGAIEVTAKAAPAGVPRGWLYLGDGQFQSDEILVAEPLDALLARATPEEPVTFTAVPAGSGLRIGIERDRDGMLDHDETRDLVPSLPGIQNPFNPAATDSTGDDGLVEPDGIPDGENDFDNDGETNAAELMAGTNPADNLATAPPLDPAIAWIDDESAILLEWTAPPLAEYEILWTADLVAWATAGGGTVTSGTAGGRLQWTDTGPPVTDQSPGDAPRRFYLINRIR